MMTNKTKRERLSREDRRAQIIDAALTLFAAKGFAATRTHEIAAAAGISETLIFQHFKTKEELIRSCLDVLVHSHPLAGSLNIKPQAGNDAAFLKTIAGHFIERNREDPRIMKLLIYIALEGYRTHEAPREHGPSAYDLLVEFIRQRVTQGAFRRVEPEIAARLFIETVFMYLADQTASITGPALDFSGDEVIDTLITIFLNGLKAGNNN